MKKMNKKNNNVKFETKLTPAGIGTATIVGGAIIGSTFRNGFAIYHGVKHLYEKHLEKKNKKRHQVEI